MSKRIGIDTGGTFTDFVLFDDTAGTFVTTKVPSTPRDPAEAIRSGLAQLAGAIEATQLVVGTTVATNAVIERRGPTVLYVTNESFSDVPFIGRLDKERLYDLHWRKPKPLIQRRNCFGVRGRVDHHGKIIEPLEVDDLTAIQGRVATLATDGELVIAVSCLFSYLNAEHEQTIGEALRELCPGVRLSLSHEVSPLWREYERASTTIADAFIKPVIERYVDGVTRIIREDVRIDRWNLLASNGGYVDAREAQRRPSTLLLSGLAGGVIGARFFAVSTGHASVFSLDIGGTSCDIGLVLDGEEQYASEFNVAWGIPVSIPCVAVSTIGAGGGSIAWIDKGGLLHVGPRSAGADPGPVAYDKGGHEPTLTDANLTLGRLDPSYFLGGAMPLSKSAAETALAELGAQLSLSRQEAALAVVRTIDENMANAIRLIAVERGLDTRDFALISFGGAGPLHARAVAKRLDMKTVLVPPHPGLCSAFGAAISQPRIDRAQTVYARSDQVDLVDLAAREKRLREATVAELRRNVDADEIAVRRSADLRYAGQNYEIETLLPDDDIDQDSWEDLLKRFEVEHDRQYGFHLAGETIELVNLRVSALRPDREISLALQQPEPVPSTSRQVWFDSSGPVECGIYRRESLVHGTRLAGPCIVEETDSTTILHPGDSLRVHENGVLVIELGDTNDS